MEDNKIIDIGDVISLCHAKKVPWVSKPCEQHVALGYLLDLAEVVIKDLATDLNKIHNCDYSTRYWHLLLGPWLMQYLVVIYDRYALIKGASNYMGSHQTGVSPDSFVTPRNTYEALKLPETSCFNRQLLTDILTFLDGFHVDRIHLDDVSNFETFPNFNDNNTFKKKFFNRISLFFTSKRSIVASLSSFPLPIQKQLVTRVRGFRPIYPYIDGVENYDQIVDPIMRQRLFSTIDTKHDFEKLVYSILPKYIPICFMEGYGRLNELSNRYGKAPNVIITGTEMYSRCESYLRWVAVCATKGTKIISMQHGGNYGMEYRSEKTFIEINPYDLFYTWGWAWDQYNRDKFSKVRPMPSALLMSNQLTINNSNESIGILLVVTSIKQIVRRFDCSSMNVYNNKNYFNRQFEFYRSLNDYCKKKLSLRLYKDDLHNNYKERWLGEFPSVQLDSNLSFTESLTHCELYVCDHLTTTWLEAIALNKPTVIFVSKGLYDFTPEYQKIIDELKSVNVFHYSAESAAYFINSTFFDINKWWYTDDVQKIVLNVRKELAYSTEKSLEIWVDELNGLFTSCSSASSVTPIT